jgi:competence protein ComEC
MRFLLRRRLHFAWFIGWASLGIIVGTAACVIINPRVFVGIAWLVVAISLITVCLVSRFAWTILIVFSAGWLTGVWRGSILKLQLEHYRPYIGQNVVLKGRVSQDTSIGEKGDQRLNLADVQINGRKLDGEVWSSLVKTDIKRGDIVMLQGALKDGFGNMPATLPRAQLLEIQRPNPGDIARRFRDWFGEGVRKGIPEPQVSLGLGYLVGQKTALPPDLQEKIKIVGLTHVVVASGYNLTILVVFARKMFMGISKYIATLASGLMIVCFMMITGLSPSMTRAGFVAGLGLLVWYYGRKMHPFVLLSFAAAFTILINPSYIWGDLGWYLSFGSFIGVIVLSPLIHNYFWGRKNEPGLLRGLTVETLSAQILTMPIILLSFGQYSIYALPANILVLPFVPLAMLCTFISGAAGLIVPSSASVFGFPATLILRYSTSVIEKFANLPNSQSELVFNPALMIVSYILIAGMIIYLKGRTRHDFRGDAVEEKI